MSGIRHHNLTKAVHDLIHLCYATSAFVHSYDGVGEHHIPGAYASSELTVFGLAYKTDIGRTSTYHRYLPTIYISAIATTISNHQYKIVC